MSNNKHSANNPLNDIDHDTLEAVAQVDAVEQVFSATAIAVIDCVKTSVTTIDVQQFDTRQPAANDPLAYADIQAMNSARNGETG